MSPLELVESHLPSTLTAEQSPVEPSAVLVRSGTGAVTIDFARRGYWPSTKWCFGPMANRRGYRGRGWRSLLIEEALAALGQAGGAS